MAILTQEEKDRAGSRIDGGFNKLRKVIMNKINTANQRSDLRYEYASATASDIIRLFNIMDWRCVYCETETLFFFHLIKRTVASSWAHSKFRSGIALPDLNLSIMFTVCFDHGILCTSRHALFMCIMLAAAI